MKKELENKSIIIGFVLTIVLFLVLSMTLGFYLYPSILSIETTKKEYKDLVNEYNKLGKNGLSFSEFNTLRRAYNNTDNSQTTNEKYLKTLIDNVDESFYNAFLLKGADTNFGNYDDFLSILRQSTWEKSNSSTFKKQSEKISNILPVYVGNYSVSSFEEKELTDFRFINYIETLLNKYRLKTTNPIGISSLVPVGGEDKEDKINSKIYYIPLRLALTGRKIDIYDFIKNVKNMGRVENKDGKLIIEQDSRQLVSIDNLAMKEYIDRSTYGTIEDGGLENLLLTSQANDEYIIDLELHFYVLGVPSYKLKEEISKAVDKLDNGSTEIYNYYKLLISVQENIQEATKSNNSLLLIKYKKYNDYLKSIQKDIQEISRGANMGTDLDNLLIRALKYKNIFIKMSKELKK